MRAHTIIKSLGRTCCAVALSTTFAATAYAAGVAPSQSTPVQREQAQSRFLRGKAKLGKGQYAEALAEFNASLDIVASPNTRLYVGRCLRELGRIVEAYVELGRTEVEAKELAVDDPRYAKAAEAAHDERSKLASQLGFVEISIDNPTEATTLKVAGDAIRRGGWSEPLPVLPGNAEVIVETEGRQPITRNVEVKAGEHTKLSIDAAAGQPSAAPLPPAKSAGMSDSSRATLRSAAFVAGGAALVGLGLFTYFGLKANSTYSDLDSTCGGGACPPERQADISAGKTQQTAANIGLGVFVVGAAAGVTLWVLSAPKGAPAKGGAAAMTSRLPPRVRVQAGPTFVGLDGVF